MTHGANRSRSRKRVFKRIPSGKSVLTYREKPASKPTCPTGRELPGTARGTKVQVGRLTTSQRRPSRPYGGVLSSPALRVVLRERVQQQFSVEHKGDKLLTVGAVCMKIAGRDAGKLCVITEVIDNHFVKVDGFTRPRKVNVNHIEFMGRKVDVKKAASAKDIQAMLK